MITIKINIDQKEFNQEISYAVSKLLENEINKKFLEEKGINQGNYENYNYSKDNFWIDIVSNFSKDMILNQSDSWTLLSYNKEFIEFEKKNLSNKKNKKS